MADRSRTGLRVRYILNSLFVVLGALLIGDALHRGVVTGELPATSTAVLAEAGAGVVLALVGYRLRLDREEIPARPRVESREEDEEEWDEELSPLAGADLEGDEGDAGGREDDGE